MKTFARSVLVAALASVAAVATPAAATTISFDDGTVGTAVGSKYASLGVVFSGTSFTTNYGLPGSSGALGIFSTSDNYRFGSDNPLIAAFS